MRSLFAQLLTALVAAIIGGAVSVFALTGEWFWSSFSEKFWYQLSSNVIGRMDFLVSASPALEQHVDWKCPPDMQLVSASCTGANPTPQVAVGPTYHPDRSFSCDRYGPVTMAVQGTAICFRIRK